MKDNAEGTIAVEAKLLTVERWANVSTSRHSTHREVCVRHRMKDDFVAKTERVHHDDVHSVEAPKDMEDEVSRPVLSRYHMLSDRLLRPTVTGAAFKLARAEAMIPKPRSFARCRRVL